MKTNAGKSKEFYEICNNPKSKIMSDQSFQTLGEFIIDKQEDFLYSTGELSRLLSAIRLASKVVNRQVNKDGIADIIGMAGTENIQGEEQQKLDVLENEIFVRENEFFGQKVFKLFARMKFLYSKMNFLYSKMIF